MSANEANEADKQELDWNDLEAVAKALKAARDR
jgi:hypothetical protein